jgi:hypothetical protein
MSDIKVKEPQFPQEGEYTLDTSGNLVQYVNGQWIKADNGR